MYVVQATRNGYQVPTFYLDKNVQGIMNLEHALQIAREILGARDGVLLDVYVNEV